MLHIRRMAARDVPFGMGLCRAANWNTTETDWHRALDLEPAGCFLAESDGQPAGTATAAVFGEVAWIALVLVEAERRKQGIGTELMKHTLAYLDGRGVRSVCLTATPLGQPIYEKLGFVGEYRLTRFEGTLPAARPAAGAEPVEPRDLDELARLELLATGIDRRRLIARQYAEQREAARLVRRDGRIVGFLLVRSGASATFLGPCLGDAEAGPLLLEDAFARYAGQPVLLDVPLENACAVSLAEAQGLTRQRSLYRMWRGPAVAGSLDDVWASWGPEKG